MEPRKSRAWRILAGLVALTGLILALGALILLEPWARGPGEVEIVLRDAESGAPVSGEVMSHPFRGGRLPLLGHVEPPYPVGLPTGWSGNAADARGMLRLKLEPGRYVVDVTAAGHAPARTPSLAVRAGRRTEVRLELRTGATIEGRVLRRGTRAPIASTRVFPAASQDHANHRRWLIESTDRPVDIGGRRVRLSPVPIPGLAQTDAEGRFRIEHAPAGRFFLYVPEPRYPGTLCPVEIPESGRAEVEVLVDAPATIKGVVKGFPPLQDAPDLIGRVAADHQDGPVLRFDVAKGGGNGLVLAENGRFEITGLGSGTYRLRLLTTDSDRTELERTVTVAAGETVEVELAR